MDLQGGCLCGAARYLVSGDPRYTTVCHCTDCRKASGAPFLVWAVVEPAAFHWETGEPARFRDPAGDLRGFCAACGTQLTMEVRRDEKMVLGFTVSTLDAPETLVPEDEIWTRSRIAWMPAVTEGPQHGLERPT